MQTNRQKHYRVSPFAVIALALLAAVFFSTLPADTENTPPVETRPVAAPQPTSPDAKVDTPNTQQAAEKTPPVTAVTAKPIQEYKPSEKIGADSAVSFPIDI